ncbi:MAG: signal peptide peptidase SppA [Tepidisphaeraceae bacterium]|jgi:protease-4
MKWNSPLRALILPGTKLFFPCLLALLASGCGIPSFLVTPVENSGDLQEVQVQPGQGLFAAKVAIIPVEGVLANVKSGSFLGPSENPLNLFTQELDKAANDSSVKAVVLRVNSPGGAVGTSDTMYDEVLKFRKKTGKPVIASAQEVDASGAYYVSCACDKIVVHPAGIMGSIGVIFEDFDVVGTLNILGIKPEAIKSAPMKDIGSPFKHMTDDERAVLQGLVDSYFARFKGIVFANRPFDNHDELDKIADGRVFTGDDAVKLHLADQVGRLDDAIDLARQLAKTPNAQVIMYKRSYDFGGSIYADTDVPSPQAQSNVTTLQLPKEDSVLPGGFYYLWMP